MRRTKRLSAIGSESWPFIPFKTKKVWYGVLVDTRVVEVALIPFPLPFLFYFLHTYLKVETI